MECAYPLSYRGSVLSLLGNRYHAGGAADRAVQTSQTTGVVSVLG